MEQLNALQGSTGMNPMVQADALLTLLLMQLGLGGGERPNAAATASHHQAPVSHHSTGSVSKW